MNINNYEVPDSLQCWCGLPTMYDHTSSMQREDGKKTIIYKCVRNHRTFYETQEKGSIKKPKESKSNKQTKKYKMQLPTEEENTNERKPKRKDE